MRRANFSRAILKCAEGPAAQSVVTPHPRAGETSDLRFRSLAGTPALRRLLDRLSRRSETVEWLPAALPV